MKALRYVLIAIAGIVVLLVAAVVVATMVLDPNDYKPQIEKVVEKNTNLDLILAGDIDWSLIPIGLELNDVEAKLDGEQFVSLKQLVAQVDFWSLIAMAPAVDTFILDGLDARMVKNKDGQGNWQRVMPEPAETPEEADTAAAQDEPAEPETAETSGDSAPLKFNVEEVRINNAKVHYIDESTGQDVTLEDFSVTANDIMLGQFFPLEMGFRFATNKPDFEVIGKINARLMANEALKQFEIQDLDSSFEMNGEPLNGKTVTTGLTGNITADLENETASLKDFALAVADLTLKANLDVTGFGESPKLAGDLKLEEFSIRKLLAELGQADINTSDPDVLEKASFSTDIGGDGGKVQLDNLKLVLDDTTFNGSFGLGLENTAIALNLQGDKINVDRYLPPKDESAAAGDSSDQPAESDSDGAGKTAAPADESDLLPLETLRGLALDINLGLEELIASNLTISDIKSKITANNGLIKVQQFGGNLYEGDFNVTATLDARKDNPTWKISERANNIQTLPLLTDLAEVTLLSGGANLTADITTQGNRMSTLRNNAKGDINFKLAEGSFNKMNLTRMACTGIAFANGESLGTDGWGTTTPFNDMHGTLKIDGNTINNTDLTAALAGMELKGDGTVDLKSSNLDYEIGLRVVGELHRDKACRVTEYVEGVVIPVECRGDISGEPAKLCSFDGSRFRDTLKGMASNAAKQKAKDEANKAIDDKVGKELEKHVDKETSDKVKDALKGLFK
ncbi:MAG: AsmA family protein [Alteromonadaceae bacterium]|nr:AsmA family protein [Alteromonadaceae bacterium]MBH86692.1 AsmA family protein [Alteromonadaceae bacterium]|tara:strand:- start:52745 stop:54964 length:2220 start_codon:yes stop_codon:yes gene_type:complete